MIDISMKNPAVKIIITVVSIIGVFFMVKIATELKTYSTIGRGVPASTTMSFSGNGEVFATADIATISFTVRAQGKNVKTPQDDVTATTKKALDVLKKSGVLEKDIKTTSYTSYPEYEQVVYPPCFAGSCPTPKKPQIIGYSVSQTITVKVRNVDTTGSILGELGTLNITEISGPEFVVDNDDVLKAEARKIAIEDAKKKAEALARDLGIHLVRIVDFSESNNQPMYERYGAMSAKADMVAASPAPELPKGENKITSQVTISYEIR